MGCTKNAIIGKQKHYVGRVVYFGSKLERNRFIQLYEDLFNTCWTYDEENEEDFHIYITISIDEFNEIVKSIELINVRDKHFKTRYWKTENALVLG